MLEGAKAAGAANKQKAISSAVAAAKEAVAKGFLVAQLHVGLDSKAVQEAYKAVVEAQPTLPALFVSADTTGKDLAGICNNCCCIRLSRTRPWPLKFLNLQTACRPSQLKLEICMYE